MPDPIMEDNTMSEEYPTVNVLRRDRSHWIAGKGNPEDPDSSLWWVQPPNSDWCDESYTDAEFRAQFVSVAEAEAEVFNAAVRRLMETVEHHFGEGDSDLIMFWLESQLLPEGEDHAD